VLTTERRPMVPAPYLGTGQGQDRRRRRRRGADTRVHWWRAEMTVCAAVLVVVTVVLTAWPGATPTRTVPAGLRLVRSGLGLSDSFGASVANRQLLDRYAFNGSARPGLGWVDGTRLGLDVGVRPHAGWQGWFAVTIHSLGADTVWHAVVSRPPGTVRSGVGEAVFAVQSASTQHNGSINYVVVASLVRRNWSGWEIGTARGVVANAQTRVLWRTPRGTAVAASEPVTIRTDGRHRLEVWLGRRLAYSSVHLDMNDPPPFQAYLEVQAQDRGYVSRFTDFWVADAAAVTVQGVPPGARVELDTAQGVVVATAGAGGTAALRVPPPELVGTATLVIVAHGKRQRFAGMHYAGGDVFELAAPGPGGA